MFITRKNIQWYVPSQQQKWVCVCVCVSERLPYLVFFDKLLNRFTQADHERFEDAFSTDGDVHNLSKNSYHLLKSHTNTNYLIMDPTGEGTKV